MKFAVIKTGGKQYVVSKGDVLDVEKLGTNESDKFTFEEVLLVSNDGKITLGTPVIEGAKVEAQVVKEYRDKKVWGIKYKAKKRYRRKFGHRQGYTQVEILSV